MCSGSSCQSSAKIAHFYNTTKLILTFFYSAEKSATILRYIL